MLHLEEASLLQIEQVASASAGQPIRLEFDSGGRVYCAVTFDRLGIYEDLTDGGELVDLPALDRGQFRPLLSRRMTGIDPRRVLAFFHQGLRDFHLSALDPARIEY